MNHFKTPRVAFLFQMFSAAALCIYACFLTIDAVSASSELPVSKFLKFGSILLCLALCLCQISWKAGVAPGSSWIRKLSPADLLLICALCLTVAADFLLGIAGFFLPGVAVFALVHLTYVKRHLRGIQSPAQEAALALLCGAFAALVWWISAPLMKRAGLFIPSILYMMPLAASLYAGLGVWIRSHFGRENRVRISMGISLFFAVDVGVAYFHALPPGPAATWLGVGIWAFYLPAQWLLALSASPDENTLQRFPVSPSQPASLYLLVR